MTTPARPPGATATTERLEAWHRLHPLTPIVRAGPLIVAFVVVLVLSAAGKEQATERYEHLAVLVVVLVVGLVSWLVTRWRVEDGVLRIDRGLIRRSSGRFPLTQVQAVDIVRPFLARVFGLAELRVRMAGSSRGSGRLAYLTLPRAEQLRARFLALAHGLSEDEPPPPERQLVKVRAEQLVASLALSGPGLAIEAVVVALVVLLVVAPGAAGAVAATGSAFLLGLVIVAWRRFNGDYGLTVAESPDGLRLRSGLLATAAETIPRGRVQAARMTQPLLWRLLGWCRLEVEVAGKQRGKRENESQSRALRSLLAVGSQEQAAWLLDRVLPGVPADGKRPPRRAQWKSPLRYRHLSFAANDDYVVSTSGRLRLTTDWVPLAKVQSIRRVEGPLQRRLRLASVRLDTAGRNVQGVLRDRDRGEADALVWWLADTCRLARAGGKPRLQPSVLDRPSQTWHPPGGEAAREPGT